VKLIKILFSIAGVAALSLALGCASDNGAPTPAEARLIASADRICAESRAAFKRLGEEFRGDTILDIAYSQALFDISKPSAERLAALDPPASVSALYEKYVELQRWMAYDDGVALGASHAVHPKEYLIAHKRHDREQREGYELAREIGFKECSGDSG
jgi:hypothetical protein